ncbi:MAG: ATP-dependent DNA helicase [Candidatus Dojkabacteria bacterium]|jgi:DNA helicase-2/ATP-dependent DNA helicase PcrA|nr:ATP-dependent helicase [Candidatus Dojkabacteria bacterium]MDD2270421.1 ATP-dependent DNA helicase [Candidatus Dojkabacteria bacterium]
MAQIRLNENQKKAVEHKEGPLLIIAGAGTGKTAVITQRVIHIMKSKWAKPSEILALTFTEKAAQEMVERIDIAMEYGYEEPWISTFHAFCDRTLREDGHYIGLDTNFSLMTQAQAYILMRKHLFDFPLDIFRPQGDPTQFITDLIKHFSRLQDEDCAPGEYIKFVNQLPKTTEKERGRYAELKELAQTYEMYNKIKIEESKLDFGDLIILTLKLFRERPSVLRKYQDKFRYILVDEFQDTNYTQNVLVNTLVLGKDYKNERKLPRNLTVVGDDDQAIYKFRGAAISNILQFKEKYPDAKEIVLTQNYRSRQEILDSAYRLIKHNDPHRLEITEKIDKKLVASNVFENSDEDAVNFVVAGNENAEAEWVAEEILNLTGNKDIEVESEGSASFNESGQSSLSGKDFKKERNSRYHFSDFAILTRSNAQSDIFVQTLRYYGIPYKLGGQRALYTREEIQNLISFLRILADYTDGIAMYDLLSMEIWGVSPREFVELNRLAREKKISLFEELENLWEIKLGEQDWQIDELEVEESNLIKKILSPVSVSSISDFLLLIDKGLKMVKEGKSIGEILYNFVTESGYIQYLVENESNENQFKISNIAKFFDLIKTFEKNNPQTNIYEYLDYLEYSIKVGDSPAVDQSDFDDFDGVNILTVHSAKGLEFPVVFICNLVSDRFPTRNMSDRIALPEELIKESISEELDSKEEQIAEERRLFYVGATRAKEKLYLTASHFYGDAKRKKKPSIFLYEILDEDVNESFSNPVVGGIEESAEERMAHFKEGDDILEGDMQDIDTTKRVSYSQLNTYEDCPKKYKYSYVLKVPSRPHASLSFGSTIHNTLKDFYTLFKDSKEGLEGIVEKPDEKKLLELYESHWMSHGYDSKAHEEKRKASGIAILKSYYKNLFNEDQRPYRLEEPFSVHVGESVFVGKIDRIDVVDDSKEMLEVEIIDYKTGKVKNEANVKKDLQLPLYALFAEQKLGLKVVSAKYVFVEHSEVVEVNVSEERKEEAGEKVVEIIEEIKKKNFIATPGYLCRYCDYNTVCEDAMV